MRRPVALVAALAAALVASPAPAAAPPPPPPYTGAYQPRGVDEIGLWREGDEEERELAASPLVIRDEALNAYVRRVLCDTVGADRCAAARIYILRVPVFNASMAPNGTMRVYSGLLLRARSEAELAAVLGHEFGHFEARHSLAHYKAHRTGTDIASWAAVLGGMSNDPSVQRSFNDLQISVLGALFRFNRDQEREADALGLAYLNASPLPPQAASAIWQNQMAEAEASAMARGLKRPRFDRIAFFATHPPDAERALTMSAFADPTGAIRPDGADRYARAMAPWLPLFLDDQIKLNDFGASDYLLGSLAHGGWTAPLLVARGDLYRARGNPRDLVQAAGFYADAVARDPLLPEARRGLGLALYKTGQREAGQAALRDYLRLKPSASDAVMIGLLAGSPAANAATPAPSVPAPSQGKP